MQNAQAINPGYTVVNDVSTAGGIIWWRLSGDTDLAALKESWLAAGLDEGLLPEAPTPTSAMARAVGELGTKRRLIRSLGVGQGWAVVDETPNADATLSYETAATVTLKDGQLEELVASTTSRASTPPCSMRTTLATAPSSR